MMIKPGITELDKYVDSRYTLVSMAAKRARMIGAQRLKEETDVDAPYESEREKPVTQAVNEIASGVVGYVRSEAIERAKEYEQEKINKITQFEHEKTAEAADDDNDDNDSDLFDDADELSAIEARLSEAMAEVEGF